MPRGLNKLALGLRAAVRDLLKADGITVCWLDTQDELESRIEAGTLARWLVHRRSRTLPACARKLAAEIKKRGDKLVVAAGPFHYESDLKNFWWCDYGNSPPE